MKFDVRSLRQNLVPRHTSRIAVSVVSAALIVLIAIATVAGAYFVSGGSLSAGTTSNITSQSQSTTSQQSTFITLPSSSAVSYSSSSPTTNQPPSLTTIQQYPLVWQSTSPTVCDMNSFCVVATLGFSGHTVTTSESATTITGSNGTTVVISSTTTIIRTSPYPQTTVIEPRQNASYLIAAIAFIQDAVTGQNVTTSGGGSYLVSGCAIQPTGFTHCVISAPSGLPPGTYKVTVYITKGDALCSLVHNNPPCTSQLLAPPSPTITITE
jgi:hypothetical protein